jgi:hypothetical protein
MSDTPVKNKKNIRLAEHFVNAVLNRDNKSINKAISKMVNNRISAKIKKVAQTEDLI